MNSIPGLPVIYYGSEFGMSGASDPDNRRMMRFSDQLNKYEKETLEEVSKIINIRKNHSALRHGDFYTLQADDNIYAYVRSDLNERILVVLNKSESEQYLHLEIPERYNIAKINNLKNNEITEFNNNIEINSKSWGIYQLL